MDIQEEEPASIAPSIADMQAQIDALKAAILRSATGTTSGPQKTPFKPKPPTIGGIKELTPTDYVAWTGGKPNLQWTAIDSNDRGYTSPGQFRSHSVSTSQKSHETRQTGLSIKMTKKGDLKRFETNVWSHLQDKGLDTIAYLPDAVDTTRVSSVVTEYTRFSVDSATKQAQLIVNKYDEYDTANDHEACEFLLNSLDPTLADDLRMDRRDGDNFPIMYIRLIRLIRSTSIDHFDTLKATIRKVKASQFPGQDLNAMSRKIQIAAQELDTAGQYDHNLTLAILDSFIEAGGGNGPDAETYRFPLRNKRGQLETKLLEIAYMDPSVAQAEMTRDDLTWRSICDLAKNQYQSLYEKNKWEPAHHARDSKGPPAGFGNLAANANVLMQQGQTRDTSNDTCHKCGKTGHWATTCTNPRQANGGRNNNNNDRRTGGRGGRGGGRGGGRSNGRSQNRNNGGAPNTHSWKKKAPTNGEPTLKYVEGKTWRWCETCARWSTTHGTAEHTGGTTANSGPQANTLFHDPSAWCGMVFDPNSAHSKPALPVRWCGKCARWSTTLLSKCCHSTLSTPSSCS
jgi:hypothetical protein